jgi:hypothetical protein
VIVFFYLFLVILSGTALLAAAVGGRDERLGVAAVTAAAIVTPLVSSHAFKEAETGILIVDAGLFVALLLIALRSAAFWPIWAAGFQLCGLAAHFAAAKLPTMVPTIYAQTLAIWTFPVLGALGAGIWFEARMRHGRR